MTLETRPLTGIPPWPVLLLAGGEKVGKSYAAAAASSSDLVDRTFWVGIGEDTPDEYGKIPGQRVELVTHTGTHTDILRAIRDVNDIPVDPKTGKPHLLVVDSMTRLWDLYKAQGQDTANRRAIKRNRNPGEDGADMTMDLWNTAKDRWSTIVAAIRAHVGPVIVTSRLELSTVVDGEGRPTKEKVWKVQAEKNLGFEVGAIVQLRAYRQAVLTGVRSLLLEPNEEKELPDFTVDGLWRRLGLDQAVAATRNHDEVDTTSPDQERARLLDDIRDLIEPAGTTREAVAEDWAQTHPGDALLTTSDIGGLELLRSDLEAKAQTRIAAEK